MQKSIVAICAYSRLFLDDDKCDFMPNREDGLKNVARAMQKTVTSMRSQFWGELGTDKLPSLLTFWVDKHANQNFDGAKAIRDAVVYEYDQLYFANGLRKFFGVSSYSFVIYQDVSGSDEHYMWATGMKFRYSGYNIMYAFENGVPGTYKNGDCYFGDAHSMATCLRNMHDDDASVWVLHDRKSFWAAAWNGAYEQDSGVYVRIVTPGAGLGSSMLRLTKMSAGGAGDAGGAKAIV